MDKVYVFRLNDDIKLPRRKNPTDAGMDFFAPYDIVLEPNTMKVVRTGVVVVVPEGYMLLIKPRGRSIHLVGAGVIDAYYHPGEILIKVVNPTKETIVIRKGEGFAQGILVPIVTPEIVEITEKELKQILIEEGEHARRAKGGILGNSKD